MQKYNYILIPVVAIFLIIIFTPPQNISPADEIEIYTSNIEGESLKVLSEWLLEKPQNPKEDSLKKIEVFPEKIEGLAFRIYSPEGLQLEDFLPKLIFKENYSEQEGVLTFRGDLKRTSPSYGSSSIQEKRLEKIWEFRTSSSTWGGGAGWTGQPTIIKWKDDVKQIMNIKEKFKKDENFVEVIYASLDGNIYFFDLKSGEESRSPISIGNPLKGSLSLDPRGYPLLYVGDGIPEKNTIGYHIFSLIDGEKLFFINGRDPKALRNWGAFDSSGIVHEETDTLIIPGENGLLYIVRLNTIFNLDNAKISLEPQVIRYVYRVQGQRRLGIESSVAVYKNLLYFADNSGYIQCIDLTTLNPLWIFDGEDDTDATVTLDIEDGVPFLYTANEIDFRNSGSPSQVRKIHGVTGELVWQKDYPCYSRKGENPIDGGAFATNVVGKNNLDNLVISTLARYGKFNEGIIMALDKTTGDEVWENQMNHYGWSSPVDFYNDEGRGYLIQCDSMGNMILLEGRTGRELHRINLGSNIESSPAIFRDYIVVATRGGKMFGVKIH
ncbi:MAG: PQQ-binding-like beta-propeller repeat protein [Clostridiaceae bacterium]|nr:PQQ-binding-like beta-propeller repeat protein [Clostridiaceae bacterium]